VIAPALLLLPAVWLSAAPFTREQPDVRAGNERLLQGDHAGALERYAAAEHAVGPRPELDYDRGIALVRQGKTAEALSALRRAAERGDGPLASRALQNAGAALDATGDREGAIRAFADALARDPSNEDARFDLEVLLRRRSEERRSGRARDEPERREDASKSGSPGDGERAREQDARGTKQGAAAAREEERRQGGEAERPAAGEPTSRQDAERLLDAVRARERQLPPGAWRRREARRRDVEKDW
jgi:Ca-activated chloride channel family protein